jgi:hypothetical protein
MEGKIIGYNLRGQITHVFNNTEELKEYFNFSSSFFNSISIGNTMFYFEEEFYKLSNSRIDQSKIVAQVIGDKKINIESFSSNFLEKVYKTPSLSSMNIYKKLTNTQTADVEFAADFGYPQTRNMVKEEDKMKGADGGKYSATGSSAHYKQAVLEYVDKQERCYGTFLAYALCFMQIDKYRDRAGLKEGVSIEKDMVKAIWYTKCAEFLREKIELHNLIMAMTGNRTVEIDAFEEKYGLGRSQWMSMPMNLAVLQDPSKGIMPIKGLGEIVDEKLKNKE